MQIEVVKSKIHRVKVTGADLNYIGSITIDEDLMDWKDETLGYSHHSLVDDVERITGSKILHPIFSIVQQWNS